MSSAGLSVPSMKNQGVLQPSWCRSQHPGMKLWGFQTHSWSCLGICNFQQEDAPAQDSGVVTHLSLLGSEQSLVRQLLEEFSLFYCRAGFCDQIKKYFFAKAIPKPQVSGTVPQSSQVGWEHSSGCLPNLPFPERDFAGLPFTLQTRRKTGISANLGLSPQEWHPPAGFCGTPLLCAALQAAELCRQARGTRQFSALQ